MKRFLPFTCVTNTVKLFALVIGVMLLSVTTVHSQNTTPTQQDIAPMAVVCNNLAVSITSENVSCNGLDNGSATAVITGGTGPFSYLWSPGGETTSTIDDLAPGMYSVVVTDQTTLCTETANVTITEPDAIVLSLVVTNQIQCFGDSDASIDLTITGGTPPYDIAWSNGESTEDISGLSAGLYSVIVIDANGCKKIAGVTITQPNFPLELNVISQTNINCGQGSGAVTVEGSGGTPPYMYGLNSGALQSSGTFSGLAAGTYNLMVIDANGCTANEMVTITDTAAGPTITATQNNVACFGDATGSIDLTITGGTSPFSFNWSNGATTEDISGLTAGTYTVTVTDSNGCSSNETYTITQPASQLTLTATQINNACAGATTGSIDLTVSGGAAPYSFLWSNGATTEDISNLSAGTYSVTVTDANGCTASDAYTITEPASPINLTATQMNVSCFGGSNGAIDLTVSGGTAPFSFAWSNGATSEDISGLTAGTYTVNVTDANGCAASETFMITQPASDINLTTTQVNVACFGDATGSIDLMVSGGTAPYTYAWSNGATTEDISALTAGSYNVTVTDANGCTAALGASIVITQPASGLSITITTTDESGPTTNDGTATATVTGGTPPYTYVWSPGGEVTPMITGLSDGVYTVTVTDANGCTLSESATINDGDCNNLDVTTTMTSVSCNGLNDGTASATVTGGVGPFSYLWSPGGETTSSISDLTAGTYAVTVTDQTTLCTASSTITVTEADPIVLTLDVVGEILCFGDSTGAIDLTISGGTPPYTIAWSNGASTEDISGLLAGTYSVIVIDANGCKAIAGVTITQPDFPLELEIVSQTNIECGIGTGSVTVEASGGTAPYMYSLDGGASQSSGTFSNLTAGTYTIMATDANGCTTSISVTITDTGDAPQITATQVNVACFGGNTGSIDLTVSGGVAPYSFLWSNGATTEDISGLTAGTYSVTVTGANGCFTSETYTITEPASGLELTATQQNVLCFGGAGGSIDVTVSGGTTPYTYVWSNGATTEDLSGLTAGTYSITVTDANSCTASETYTITEPASGIEITATQENVACFGGATGAIDITVIGGTAPYTYVWSNGATTEDLSGLTAGSYTITVTDANGCTASETFTITESASAIEITATQENVACLGGATGAIDVAVSGGTAPYTFLWSNGATSEDLSGLTAGSYTVTVTDANGCTASETFTITEPASGIEITATQENVACLGGATGSIDVTVNGGTAPYTFLWSNGATSEDISGLTAGTYTVTVTDANGCTATETYTITEPATGIELSATLENVTCFGGDDGSIDLTVTGGTAPYTFLWSNGATTEDLTGLAAGTYSVTVTDANGCTATEQFTITAPSTGIEITAIIENVACFDSTTGSIDITVSGGIAPYTFLWSNGATTEDLAGLSDGTYTVTVTDAAGCSATQQFTVTEPSSAINVKATQENITCFGDATGSIDITVSGGDAPYSYAWSNGATTEDIENLTAGTYTVTITDANGCVVTEEFTITQPDDPIVLEIIAQTDVVCDQGTGSITVEASGGTPPFMYSLDGGASQSNGTFSDLAAGNYEVTVTDANGCTETLTIFINNNCIALIKTGTFNDEDGDGCSDVGETIGYVFIIINTGNSELTNITVTDALATVMGGPLASLAAGATDNTTFTATYEITQADIDAGEFANQATVEGTTPINTMVSDLSDDNSELEDDMTITTLCQNASISLEKSGVFNDENGNLLAEEGETISYSFSVTNTGDVTLYNVTLTDDLPGISILGGPIAELAPGEIDGTTFTATYSITQDNVNSGEVVNQAIITATDGAGNMVQDTSDDPFNTDNVDMNGDGEPDDPTETMLPSVASGAFNIFNGISPNEDGLNDYFKVEGINDYPDNNVKIYNRWGVLVYETERYEESDSPTANNFRGRSNGRATVGEGNLLPTGTYFYVINLSWGDGELDNPLDLVETQYIGYLYINR